MRNISLCLSQQITHNQLSLSAIKSTIIYYIWSHSILLCCLGISCDWELNCRWYAQWSLCPVYWSGGQLSKLNVCTTSISLYCRDERFSVFEPSYLIQFQLQFKFDSYQLTNTLNSTEKSIQHPIQNTPKKTHACNSHRLMAETPEKANWQAKAIHILTLTFRKLIFPNFLIWLTFYS